MLKVVFLLFPGRVLLSLELHVTNFDLEELLLTEHYRQFRATLAEVYSPSSDATTPTILSLTDPRERGILIPELSAKLG